MRWLVVAVTVMLISGCGAENDKAAGADGAPSRPATSGATPSAASDEQKLREVFGAYNAAVVEGDAAAACRYLAPESVEKLRANLKKILPSVPKDCEGSTRALYKALEQNPAEAQMLKTVSRTAKIEKLKIVGDSAILDWSARVEGKRVPVSQSARKINGSWKLVDVSN